MSNSSYHTQRLLPRLIVNEIVFTSLCPVVEVEVLLTHLILINIAYEYVADVQRSKYHSHLAVVLLSVTR